MALKGSFSKQVNSHWRVRGEWRGTQSDSGNYTDITFDVYWESIDSYGTTYSGQSKSGSSTISGTRETFSFSAKLNGKQSKKVQTQTKRIHHNDEGKASVSLSASLDIELDIGGWVGTVTISDSDTLDTIPRKSKLTSSASWTAGSNRSVTLSRSSSKFRHEAEFYVKERNGEWKWVHQVEFSTSQTSKQTDFTDHQNSVIFDVLDGRDSAQSKIELQTFSGDTHIGTDEVTGTVTAPGASDVSSINGEYGGTNTKGVYIDQQIKIGIKRLNSKFKHTVVITAGTFSKTFTNVDTEVTYTLTSAEQTSLYNQTKNTNTIDGNIEVTTYYEGEKVRSATDSDLDFYVRESINKPTFSASSVSYQDTNTTTSTITGSNQIIVQNKSKLKVTIGSGASMKNGATFARYVISVDGQEKALTTATGSVEFPSIRGNTNQVLSVKVVDSRGLSTTVTKTVTVVPYSAPVLSVKATRQNLFEAFTSVSISGSFTSLSGKNKITKLERRYVNASTGGVEQDWTSQPVTQTTNTFTASTSRNLDVTLKYNVEVRVTDTMGTTVTTIISVEAGQPIFFIDSAKRSLGFNDFPTNRNEFKFNGRLVFGANQYANPDDTTGEGFGALFMNNSDIGGVNGIFFNDVANNKGEGLHFLKSGAPIGSPNKEDYDTLYIRDRKFYMDDVSFLDVKGSDSSGIGVLLGGGGLTIIGSGESADLIFTSQTSWNSTTERTAIGSDTDVHIFTGLQDGWSGRKEFTIDRDGNLSAPGSILSGNSLELNGGSTLKHKTGALYLEGKDGATMFNNNSSAMARIDLREDGKGYVKSETIYNRTTSSGANVHINGSQILHRVTSSLQYKTDVLPVEGLDYAKKLLDLEPKSWIDRNQMYEKLLNDMGVGEFEGVPEVLPRNYGLIAEEMVELGLGEYVMRNEDDGALEGIQYDRLWTLLIPIVRDQQRQIDELKSQLNAVE